MDFDNFYVSGNGNECPLQASYLLIYFICDVNMTSLSCSWHGWAATASAACMARLGAVAELTNGEHAYVFVFVPMVDILIIPCDCQFVFSVLDELFVSHHAWCSG